MKSTTYNRRKFLGYLAGGLAAAAVAGGSLLLKAPVEEELTYDRAAKNPELRQAWLDQLAKEYADSAVERINYDPQFAMLRQCITGKGFPYVIVNLIGDGSYKLETGHKPIKPEQVDLLVSPNATMAAYSDVISYATGKAAPIYVREKAFSVLGGSTQEQEIIFRSFLVHEGQHAKDYCNGIDLGEGHRIDNEVALVLAGNKLLEPLAEARAYCMQLHYIYGKADKCSTAIVKKYVDNVKLLKERCVQYPARIGKIEILNLIDRFLHLQNSDPLLSRFLG